MNKLGTLAVVFALLLVVPALIAYEAAVWRECTVDHPWWYCLRVISR